MGPFVYTIGTMRNLLMQRVMASLPGRVPITWVLPVIVLAALSTSTFHAFADLHALPSHSVHSGSSKMVLLLNVEP